MQCHLGNCSASWPYKEEERKRSDDIWSLVGSFVSLTFIDGNFSDWNIHNNNGRENLMKSAQNTWVKWNERIWRSNFGNLMIMMWSHERRVPIKVILTRSFPIIITLILYCYYAGNGGVVMDTKVLGRDDNARGGFWIPFREYKITMLQLHDDFFSISLFFDEKVCIYYSFVVKPLTRLYCSELHG